METWKYVWAQIQSDHSNCPVYAEDLTQQAKLHCPVNGNRIRARFSNLYGGEDAHLQEISFAVRKGGRGTAENVRPVTFGGKPDVVLKRGESTYCDVIDVEVCAGDELIFSMYFKEKTAVVSSISLFSQELLKTVQCQGNQCARIQPELFSGDEENTLYFLDSVEACSDEKVHTVVAFGDSITQQGHYTGALQKIFSERLPGKVSIYSCGIGGNRILHDTPQQDSYYQAFGKAGLERFEEDTFGREIKPDLIFILEGVNDISQPYYNAPLSELVTAREVTDGLRHYIDICQKYGVKTVLATILPFGNFSSGWNLQAETLRNEINQWIRGAEKCMAIVDLDSGVKATETPEKLAGEYDCGDGLHVNAEGGKRMAEMIYEKIKEFLPD